MYVTGAVGQSEVGESFTFDYDLPNDTVYAETCAQLGLCFFTQRMLLKDLDSRYSDVMERVLYNGALSGMSLDGTRFFYVNPLEVVPKACEEDDLLRHVVNHSTYHRGQVTLLARLAGATPVSTDLAAFQRERGARPR
jgi:DUF1680 family protein